jgi:hypothetical protein
MDARDEELDEIVLLTTEQRIELVIQKLPTLAADDVPPEDTCPICLVPFARVLAGETAHPEQPGESPGVTKLTACGHMFCRFEYVLAHALSP